MAQLAVVIEDGSRTESSRRSGEWCIWKWDLKANPKTKPSVQAIPFLMEVFYREHQNPPSGTAHYSRGALVRIGRHAVPDLVEALKDQNANVRNAAAQTLGSMGTNARGATLALGDLLRDQSDVVRVSAARALGRIGWDARSAVRELRRVLGDENRKVRESAAESLRRIERKRKQGGTETPTASGPMTPSRKRPKVERAAVTVEPQSLRGRRKEV